MEERAITEKYLNVYPLTSFDVQGSVHRECTTKCNQQDATLHNSFIIAKCSTCFRQFLRPSSEALKLYIKHLVLVKTLLLTFDIVEELELQFQLLNDSER
jgi:hypothetical protein